MHDDYRISIRWLLPLPDVNGDIVDIRGIDVLHVEYNGCHFKISKAYSEYNGLLAVAAGEACDGICDTLQPSVKNSIASP